MTREIREIKDRIVAIGTNQGCVLFNLFNLEATERYNLCTIIIKESDFLKIALKNKDVIQNELGSSPGMVGCQSCTNTLCCRPKVLFLLRMMGIKI